MYIDFYYIGNYVDPDRAEIREFVLSTFGSNYVANWKVFNLSYPIQNSPLIGNETCRFGGISEMEVNLTQAQNFPNILKKVEEVKAIRQEVYPELFNIIFQVHNQTLSQSESQSLINYNTILLIWVRLMTPYISQGWS
jgi:hypothetical protein